MRFYFTNTSIFLIVSYLIFQFNNSNESNNSLNIINFLRLKYDEDYIYSNKIYSLKCQYDLKLPEKCSIKSCFDIKYCRFSDFNIFVYDYPKVLTTKIFDKIIQLFRNSSIRTSDYNKGCLKISSIDTLDRDIQSGYYINNIDIYLNNLMFWNHGKNILFFNFYSGTWPNYIDEMNFSKNLAFYGKSSLNQENYKKNFDVSFPLFNIDPIALITQEKGIVKFLTNKKYLVSFKGKRYLTGYGSETRNSLFHLNNKNDLIIFTTCRHGSYLEDMKNAICKEEERLYKRYYNFKKKSNNNILIIFFYNNSVDYYEIIYNSTFCLIPRGRRLETYRYTIFVILS